MEFEPPKKLEEYLENGEPLITGIKNVRIGVKPEYYFLTDRRIICFNEKHFGQYDLSSIPFTKIKEIEAQIGPVFYGSVQITSEEGQSYDINQIPKEYVEPFLDKLEDAINAIAVEPITINLKKTLTGKTWSFTKPAETVFRSKAASPEVSPTTQAEIDPLKALQMRFVRGEISKDQYEDMKKTLEG